MVTDLVSGSYRIYDTEALSALATGLLPGRQHQLSLIAIDEAGNTTEYPPETASTLQAVDEDGNGLADNLLDSSLGSLADSDNDGITDDVENYLMTDVTHTTDLNDNGIPDVVELEQGIDVFDSSLSDGFVGSSRPEIDLADEVIDLVATGTYTAVEVVVGTTNADADTLRSYLRQGACSGDVLPANYEEVCQTISLDSNDDLLLFSGANQLWWIATDSQGNWPEGGAAIQDINIVPYEDFGFAGVTAAVDSTTVVEATLSG